MADIDLVKKILESYDEITVYNTCNYDNLVQFQLHAKHFVLKCPNRNDRSSSAALYVLNASEFDYPHFMLREDEIAENTVWPNGKYRYICLYEAGSVIASLQSYKEKIIDVIDRLISLLSLSPLEVEQELQKEFLYYWNALSERSKINLYIGNEERFTKLNVFQSDDETRYVEPDLFLSKRNEGVWQQRADISVFYIPIVDNRGILPPQKNHHWGVSEIIDLLYGKKISHVSSKTFQNIKTELVNTRIIDLVFKMDIAFLPVTFVARVTCRDNSKKALFQKIIEDAVSVQECYSQRSDYSYLNKVIGNDVTQMNKNVLLIGAGSVGSYVASELAKNGFRNLTVYDGESFSQENIMRWVYGADSAVGLNKAVLIKVLLELLHPEIHTKAIANNINGKSIIEEMPGADYIIFTVGSSDIQLNLNKILRNNKCKATVFFVWLEAGGNYSHILKVQYGKEGCFECLFTNSNGELVNNKANITMDKIIEANTIRNGCGGTRVAYGTAVLLRTTAALLDVMHRITDGENMENCLINISPTHIEYQESTFIAKECQCCGNRNQ